MFPYYARPPLTAQPFLLHHHSALQMNKKLPAKRFCWPRSDFLPPERQSVKSADHSVIGTKLKLDWCHESWQMQATLTLLLWVLHPWALLPCSGDVPRGLLQISAQTPPEAASAGLSVCPGMGMGDHKATRLRKSLRGEEKSQETKKNPNKEMAHISFRRSLNRLRQKRDFPVPTHLTQHRAVSLQAAKNAVFQADFLPLTSQGFSEPDSSYRSCNLLQS